MNGPTMSVADQGALYRQALKAAMADARLSAETLAAAAGRSLGKVTTVVESGGSAPCRCSRRRPPPTRHADRGRNAGDDGQVTVTFALASSGARSPARQAGSRGTGLTA